MRAFILTLTCIASAAALVAQEPRPVVIVPSFFTDPEGTPLDFAWRYAPGDGAGRESLAYDDVAWSPVQPAIHGSQLPPGGWPGTGWFRRHLIADPAV